MDESEIPPLHSGDSVSSGAKIISEYRISHEPWYRTNLLKWASYDLGNTIFSMVVVSLTFVPLLQIFYFMNGSTGEQAINQANFAFSAVLLVGNIVMAFVSPFLGAYADQMKERKGLLMQISVLCITFMAALVASAWYHSVLLMLAIFFFSNLFYQMGLVVYDSMLPFITDRESLGKVSGFGVALGYFGSFVGIGLGFALTPIFGDFTVQPKNLQANPPILKDTFALGYIPYIFPLAALMFLLFALPMFSVREKEREMIPKETDEIITEVKRNAIQTGKEIINYRSMFVFLFGWLIFVDAANTVIGFMTPMVQVGLEFGDSGPVLIVLGIGIFAAVVLTYPVGIFVDKYGPKKGLLLIMLLWISSLTIAFFTNFQIGGTRTPQWPVYVFPILVGPALGGGWVVQRQFITELAPPPKVANYFGFANIFGRISAAIGPFVWSITILLLNQQVGLNINLSTRYAIWVLAILMLIGFTIIFLGTEDVHKYYLDGARAAGDGTWIDHEGHQVYPLVSK